MFWSQKKRYLLCNYKQTKGSKKYCCFSDYFFVIGSKNSSNSLRLVEVAKNYGSQKAILIDDIDNFDPTILQWFI